MCGIVGFISNENIGSVSNLALQAIQHRGQDAAGIGMLLENGRFSVLKDLGQVTQALPSISYDGGGVSIGHVRYPTLGGSNREDAQPFFCRQPGVIMAYNGNIINYNEIKDYLKGRSIYLSSSCDMEPVLYVFSDVLMKIKASEQKASDVVAALKETYKIVKGSFSIVCAMTIDGKPTLFAARDPYGLRPGIWGQVNNGYIVASESVSIDAVNGKMQGDIPPGEVMFFRPGEKPQSYVVEKKGHNPCVFESIYFARPDAVMEGKSIYVTRIELGNRLGEEFKQKKIDVDVVVPVPDTSIPAAIAIAEVIKKPFREGFIKNRYTGRTFIMPTQKIREMALRLKLNPIIAEIKDQRILLVDDSIVRGTTLRRVVSLLREKGAKEIHLAIHCPPVISPCFYGIDMSVKEDLIAYRECKAMGLDRNGGLSLADQRKLEERMAKTIGADSLTFLSVKGLEDIFGKERCSACFDSNYPLEVPLELEDQIRCDRIGVSCDLVET